MVTLSNSDLKVNVAAHGAELQNIICDGKEYLWQGDAKYWGRRSPVLFPIVGRLYDGVSKYKGGEIRMGQHGFARDMEFQVVEQNQNFVCYRLDSCDRTRDVFPMDFRLEISYKLEGRGIVVGWRVENIGSEELAFQIGAHPAFNYPDYDPNGSDRGYFSFDSEKPLEYIIPVGKGCTGPEKYILDRDEQGMMPIGAGSFKVGTYVFEDSQLKKITLCDRERKPYVSVEFDTPIVALWSPSEEHPDVPFVCIEPWYGRCDMYGYEGEFTEREHIWKLASGEVFEASYKIVVE